MKLIELAHQLPDWFVEKQGQAFMNAMVYSHFTVEEVRETEKAIQFEIFKDGQSYRKELDGIEIKKAWTIWIPKSLLS